MTAQNNARYVSRNTVQLLSPLLLANGHSPTMQEGSYFNTQTSDDQVFSLDVECPAGRFSATENWIALLEQSLKTNT